MKNGLTLTSLMLLLILTGIAQADTVNFNEVVLSTGTEMSTEYAAYDLILSNTFYAVDSAFTEDGYGIAETVPPATIDFINPVTNLSIHWVSVLNAAFIATAYDASNNVLSTFSGGMCGETCSGSVSLSGADISRLVWHDHTGTVGIDSLSFSQLADPLPLADPPAADPWPAADPPASSSGLPEPPFAGCSFLLTAVIIAIKRRRRPAFPPAV